MPMLPGTRESTGPSRQVLEYARTLGVMARLLVEEGAYDAAWPLLEEAEQVYTREGAETYPGYATILSIQAGLLRDQANFTDARRLYERALEITTASRGIRDRDVAIGMSNLAFLLIEQKDNAAARQLLVKAIAITESLEERHPDHVRIQTSLAWLLHLQGERSASRALLEKALTTTKAMGERYPDYARGMSSLGWLLAETGDRTGAIGLIGLRAGRLPRGRLDLARFPAGAPATHFDQPLPVRTRFRSDLDGRLARGGCRSVPSPALMERPGGLQGRDATARCASAGAIPEAQAELNRLRAELTRVYYSRVPDKDLARHTSAIRDAATRSAAAETRLMRALRRLDGASGTGQGRRSAPASLRANRPVTIYSRSNVTAI